MFHALQSGLNFKEVRSERSLVDDVELTIAEGTTRQHLER